MVTLKFKKFRSGKYDDKGEFDRLYVLRNGDKVLYVGISKRGAWNRWFDGWNSHMRRNIFGQWIGNTPAGKAVFENSPHSLSWTIELWTVEDCLGFLGYNLSDDTKAYYALYAMERIEAEMISKLQPTLNAKF